MANLKIKNAPLIPNDQLESSIKIPTGGKGNYSVNLGQIAQFTKNSLFLAVQADVDRLFNEKADKSNTYTKLEVDEIISLGQGGVYGFKTYTDFLLAKDNIPANSIVTILEEGQYQGDNVWDGQVLTPSPYDPLAQSKEYTDTKLLDKADKNSVYLKSETYNNQEVYNKTEVYSKDETFNKIEVNTIVSNAKLSIEDAINNEIIKNGAALPFDETVDYAEGAFTVKDGELQQFIGGVWKKPTQTADQIIDASGRTQQEINNQIVNIKEYGGSPTDFDPSAAEAAAKATANPNTLPYIGARQTALPMQTLKVWNYCDGYLDRGAVASIRNVASFDSAEPRTEVLGIDSSAQLASYTDRDVVGLYVQAEGQPALLTSTNTTYTATTVTSADINSKRTYIRKGQIVDVLDGGVKYSSRIQGLVGNTITVDGWYKHGTSNTGTPSNGSQVKIVPNTKVWATNFNVMLTPESDAESMVGIELGTFNNKYPNGAGYGYDIWSGGQYRIGAAFQARGQYTTGLHLYDSCDTGTYVSNPKVGHMIVGGGVADTYGVLSHKQATSFLSRGATTYGYAQVTETGTFLTGINSDGAWANLKYSYRVTTGGQVIGDNPVAITNPTADGQDIFLPSAESSTFRTVYVKNISPTYTVYLGGSVEGGTGSIVIKPKECVQMFCDGSAWFVISHYKPTEV